MLKVIFKPQLSINRNQIHPEMNLDVHGSEKGRKIRQRIIVAQEAATSHLFKVNFYKFVDNKFMLLKYYIFIYTEIY